MAADDQNTRRAIGQRAEEICCQFLLRQGLILLDRNYHTPFGELDLIMRDADFLIFVEVRYRSSQQILSALESIGPKKQKSLIKAASLYIQAHKNKDYCRFDVITLGPSLDSQTIDWIPNAFCVEA